MMAKEVKKIKVVMIVGVRPQFIKASMLFMAFKEYWDIDTIIIHTGQHYDKDMSEVFFRELQIGRPKYNLGIGSFTHGIQTGKMLVALEKVFLKEKPCFIIVFGDTNSTLAGALAAAKIKYKMKTLKKEFFRYPLIVHVEAGLRSYNRRMPEEINRILTDHICDVHFCPSFCAVENLKKEGIGRNVYNVGDIMYDSLLYFSKQITQKQDLLGKLSIRPNRYYLATIHREQNTDISDNLRRTINILEGLDLPVLFPAHPRTRMAINKLNLKLINTRIITPLSYLNMLVVEKNAKLIITDSGGVQKEAFYFRVPCIILRDESEWTELLDTGYNVLTGLNKRRVYGAVTMLNTLKHELKDKKFYGDGSTNVKIAKIIRRMARCIK